MLLVVLKRMALKASSNTQFMHIPETLSIDQTASAPSIRVLFNGDSKYLASPRSDVFDYLPALNLFQDNRFALRFDPGQ